MLNYETFEVTSCSKPDSEIFRGKQFTHLTNIIRLYPDGLKDNNYCSSLMFVSNMGEFKIGDKIKLNIEKL